MFQGKFNTIIKPILFTLIIVGGVIFLAFNGYFKNEILINNFFLR